MDPRLAKRNAAAFIKPMIMGDLDYLLEGDDFLEEDENIDVVSLDDEPNVVQEKNVPSTSYAAQFQVEVLPTTPANLIPHLKIAEFERELSKHFNPKRVLMALADSFDMKSQYTVERTLNPKGFEASVSIGLRHATGSGATMAEAKEDAAGRLLKDLPNYIPIPAYRILAFKPVVKTNPDKDILDVLSSICSTRKLKRPTYRIDSQGEEYNISYIATASIGELVEKGVASKKRVAIRLAAVRVYEALRKAYNSGQVPESVRL